MSFDAEGKECKAVITVDVPGTQALALRVRVQIGLDEGTFYLKRKGRMNRRMLLLRIQECLNEGQWSLQGARFEEPLRKAEGAKRHDPMADRVPPSDKNRWDILDHLLDDLEVMSEVRAKMEREAKIARQAERQAQAAERERAKAEERERLSQLRNDPRRQEMLRDNRRARKEEARSMRVQEAATELRNMRKDEDV